MTTKSEDSASVLETVQRMTAAFHSGDLAGVMASYQQPATVVFEPEAPIDDRAQIEAMFEGSFAMRPKFEYSGHEVVIAGDVALHLAPWTMRGTAPDGSAIEQRGLSVAVLVRQPEGGWRMVIDDPHGQHLIDKHGYPGGSAGSANSP